MKNKIQKGKSSLFIISAKSILLFFLFLRPFYDGFSCPAFNFVSNSVFFCLLVLCIIVLRKKLDFSSAQISFLAFIVFCLFLVPFWPLWHQTLKEFTYMLSLLSVWVLFRTIFNQDDFPLVAQALIFALAIIVFYGIHQYFWGLEETRQMFMQQKELMGNLSETYLDRMASNRIFATFVYPNTFAGYLLLLYPVAFFSILRGKKRMLQLTGAITLAILIPVLAATESMGGWFCFLIVSFLMLLFFLVPRKFYIHSCIGLSVILIFLLYAGIKTEIIPKISSLTDRINYWTAALQIIKNHPFTGTGPGNFSQFYLQYKVPGAMEAKFAHNIVVEILVSTGLAGFILFAITIFFFARRNIKNFLETENYLLTGFMFGLFGIFLHSLVDFDYADSAISVIIFALAGIVEAVPALEKQKPKRLTKLIAGSIIILLISAVVIETKIWKVNKSIENIKTGKSRENPIQVLEKTAKIFPEPETLFIQGEIFRHIYRETKDYRFAEKAVTAYKKAVGINKFSPKYRRTLAMMLMETGQYEEAEKEFLKVIEIYPTKALYNLELGMFYRKIGKDELAEVYLDRGKKLPASSKDEARSIQEYKNGKSF
ncbi:MAG: O-antigen ligase family protein [Candidatus Omnitrophica bacterium]|nr:O-antigen ligase family protein [Candidatus Omnitrophota bacterium]MCM8827692.1 O-antigen ligase family protein [Candidatus Omnitrophota bacterium]